MSRKDNQGEQHEETLPPSQTFSKKLGKARAMKHLQEQCYVEEVLQQLEGVEIGRPGALHGFGAPRKYSRKKVNVP